MIYRMLSIQGCAIAQGGVYGRSADVSVSGVGFYMMMRMHMGYGAHGTHDTEVPNHTDPVCGMQVDPT